MIVTRQPDYKVAGAIVAPGLDNAISACGSDDEIFVIGGAQLYAAALPRADRIYLTEVDAEVAGDTYMPDIDMSRWQAGTVTASRLIAGTIPRRQPGAAVGAGGAS